MKSRQSAAVLAVAVLGWAATATAPAVTIASPASASSSVLCDSTDLVNASWTAQVSGRGGDAREPDLGEVHEDLLAAAQGKAGKTFRASVQMYFHVITDGATGAVTDEQIAAQIAVLNNTYAGGEGGAKSGFSFALAGITRTDNADWFYASPGGTNEHTMKRTLHQGGPDALNYYSTTAGDYLGWAYLPSIVTKPGQAYLDGVVVDWESMPGTSRRYAGRYDQGETGTHEVGHWLNLEHTFYGGCNAKGDFVEDTPAQKSATNGCPEGKDSCKQPGLDPIHNYMDYSYDSCYTEFTNGQVQRMRDAWLFYRAAA
jgi:hypothetical protein